jgi:hypothetical protein
MLGAESVDRQTGGFGGERCSLKQHHYQLFRDIWQFTGWVSGRDHYFLPLLSTVLSWAETFVVG